MQHDSTLYPMLAVGACTVMFWIGFLLGAAAGLGCLPLLICALGSGYLGTCMVVALEARAGGSGRRAPPLAALPPATRGAPRSGLALATK